MANHEKTYNSLISIENLEGLATEKALQHIARLTDLSLDLRKMEGLQHSIKLSEELQEHH
jgi:hypothetical protein